TGMLDLTDAVTVAYHRARLQARTAGTGGMLAVGLPAEQAAEHTGDGVDIAAVNSPTAVTLSGDAERPDNIAAALDGAGVFARRRRAEVPYLRALMARILDELRTALAGLRARTPSIPLYSAVAGDRVAGADWDAG